MLFCKDCKHYKSIDHCNKQPKFLRNMVTGDLLGRHWRSRARLQREDSIFTMYFLHTCGQRARWFKKK